MLPQGHGVRALLSGTKHRPLHTLASNILPCSPTLASKPLFPRAQGHRLYSHVSSRRCLFLLSDTKENLCLLGQVSAAHTSNSLPTAQTQVPGGPTPSEPQLPRPSQEHSSSDHLAEGVSRGPIFSPTSRARRTVSARSVWSHAAPQCSEVPVSMAPISQMEKVGPRVKSGPGPPGEEAEELEHGTA